MPQRVDRRRFLQTGAAAGIGYWVAGGVSAQESKSPNERLRLAAIGVGGKGSSDAADAARRGDLTAICDVDEGTLQSAGNRYPRAKRYDDFRKMLEEMQEAIDAVTISTPDHMHAPAALMAMRMGKHCFVQKPLAHSVYEARLMGQVAREKKVATQMGNQGTAGDGLRKAAAMLRAGALGDVKEVHVWTNRPMWPQGVERPKPQDPPGRLAWDLWLGVAPDRSYGPGYHPFAWRGWWDFGTGALGDMACHAMNMPFMGLELRDPASAQAVTSGHNRDSFPKWSIITYEFPANNWRPAVELVWYDGGKRPSNELMGGEAPAPSGCLVIGAKGRLYSDTDYGGIDKFYGEVDKSEVQWTPSPGHFEEWTRAIKGGAPAVSNFPDYAGPLTEMVLLGNLAVWLADKKAPDAESVVGEKIAWDAKGLKALNVKGLEGLIKPAYRSGYTLDA